LKRVAVLVIYGWILVGFQKPLLADDAANINWGVTTFFKALQEGGLIKVQDLVQDSYQSYDKSPSRKKLERVITIDISASVFLQNLPDGDWNKADYLENYWKDEDVIRRINERLSAFIKSDTDRGEFMLSWKKKTIDAMDLYYRQHADPRSR
jgi:hypothetical protein